MSIRPGSLQPVKLARGKSAAGDRLKSKPGNGRHSGIAMFLACEMARRVYRWSRTNLGLEKRLQRLQERLQQIPRGGVGAPLKAIDPELDARVAPLRQKDRELVIGEFDQDGGILARVGEIRGVPSISPEKFMPRTGCPVLLVDLNGTLGVRKEFGRDLGRFVQELEALLGLEHCACPVPRLLNVDWDRRSVTMSFVPGWPVRELLALAGADIRDRDSSGRVSRSREKARVREGRALVRKIMSDKQIADTASAVAAIHEAGFVLEDVKFGNIILEEGSGRPIFVDLERALPITRLPRALAEHLKQVDQRKLRDHFGPIEEAPPRQ